MSFEEELKKRLGSQAPRLVINDIKQAIINQVDQHRDQLAKDKDLNEITRALNKQIEFHAQAIVEAVITQAAAQNHIREQEDIREATIHAQANSLMAAVNMDEYFKRHPPTAAYFLDNVEEDTLKEGANMLPRELLVDIVRWLKEVIGEKID